MNQNNFPTREQKIFFPKYQYVYAIFSTSGFTKPAIDLAITHQISLIDLSGNEYAQLRNEIEKAASDILRGIDSGEINVLSSKLIDKTLIKCLHASHGKTNNKDHIKRRGKSRT